MWGIFHRNRQRMGIWNHPGTGPMIESGGPEFEISNNNEPFSKTFLINILDPIAIILFFDML
jgi:hypothetical protein